MVFGKCFEPNLIGDPWRCDDADPIASLELVGLLAKDKRQRTIGDLRPAHIGRQFGLHHLLVFMIDMKDVGSVANPVFKLADVGAWFELAGGRVVILGGRDLEQTLVRRLIADDAIGFGLGRVLRAPHRIVFPANEVRVKRLHRAARGFPRFERNVEFRFLLRC